MNMKQRTSLAAVLKKTELLSHLTDSELELLAARTVRKIFRNGELLFSEGEPCRGMHIIASGHVRMFKASATGREQTLSIDGPGGSVAEIPVFDGGPYPASAVAVDDAEIAFISRHEFREYCREHPEVALEVLEAVGTRLRRLLGIIEQLSFTTIRQRLVANLLRMARSEGRQTERGIELLLPGSHQELANQLGTVRELVSRNLMRLQAEGLLEVNARKVVVRNLESLAAVLDIAA